MIYSNAKKQMVNTMLPSGETEVLYEFNSATNPLSSFGPGANFGAYEYNKKISNPYLMSTDTIRANKITSDGVMGLTSDASENGGSGSTPGTQYWG